MAGLSPKQWEVMCFGETSYDALICDGAVRSGKTSTECVAFVMWAMEHFDRCNFILAGVSVESCKRNVVNPILATEYLTERFSMTWSSRANCLVVKTRDRANSFYVFGGKDEASYRIVQGLTAAGCLLDEVVLMPRSFVEQCMARCSMEGSKFWFSCNPGSPSHWFYREWVTQTKEKNAYRIHFKLTDNPSLSERILERYERMYTGVFKQRYIDGEWVVAEGLVYPFQRSDVTCTEEEALGDGRGTCYVSLDYGITNPFAALLWRVTRERAYVVGEYYWDSKETGRRLTDEEHYENVCKLVGDRRVEEVVVDPSASSFIELVDRRGRFDCRKANNDVLPGISVTSSMLSHGDVKIAETCDNLLREMQLYRWDEKANGDKVVKESDHACDAMRYMCQTVLRFELKGYE